VASQSQAPDAAGGSRQAIIEAAVAEFAANGFEGTRIETVAQRSGYNKALIYRHFGDKAGLFRAALGSKFAHRAALQAKEPEAVGERLVYWFERTLADPHFMRLIIHEALGDQGGEVLDEAARRRYYDAHIAGIAALQQRGAVSAELEAPYLVLAMIAATVFPSTFPQITRLVTGQAVDSPAFRQGWGRFLETLSGQLQPSAAPAAESTGDER
jgi:AcrR family transcriptional regulator